MRTLNKRDDYPDMPTVQRTIKIGNLQGTKCGSRTMPYCPNTNPAWTYPYACRSYRVEYQQNCYHAASNLAQMANMQWTHIEDVILSNTVMRTPGSMSYKLWEQKKVKCKVICSYIKRYLFGDGDDVKHCEH